MVSLQDKRYEDTVKVNQLFDESLARIRRQPGVEAAGITLGLPVHAAAEHGLAARRRGSIRTKSG